MMTLERRPRKFSEIIGQKTLVNTLKEYTKEGRSFPQVMMFEGVSGIGKSTSGFITATSLVCENPTKVRGGSFEPCSTCDTCQDIIHERFSMDCIYRDCSDMGKQDVLDLERELERGATYGVNKVVLLEESQALASKGAKGALLRVIEKPRKNVFILLLTMDKKAFPKAVLDRCSIFSFKKFKPKEISDYLMTLVDELDPEETIFPDTFMDVVVAIGDNADGSMRSGLQQFQRAVDSKIYTEADLIEELGITTNEKLESFLAKLLNSDATALFELSKGDSLSDIFNKLWYMMVDWKRAYVTNAYFNSEYEAKAKHFASNKNFNSLLDTFIEINSANTGYFNSTVFYHFLLKFIEACGKEETKVTSRRKLKD